MEAAERSSEAEREELALAWKRYEEARIELHAEGETTRKELSAKKALLEARDRFWYMTGIKLRSACFVIFGVSIALAFLSLYPHTEDLMNYTYHA